MLGGIFDTITGFIDFDTIVGFFNDMAGSYITDLVDKYGGSFFSKVGNAFNGFLTKIESAANKISFGMVTIDLSNCKIDDDILKQRDPTPNYGSLKIGIDSVDDGANLALARNVEDLIVSLVGEEFLKNDGTPIIDRRITVNSPSLAHIMTELHEIKESLRMDCENKDQYLSNLVNLKETIETRMESLRGSITDNPGCEVVINVRIDTKKFDNLAKLRKFLEKMASKIPIIPEINLTIPASQCSAEKQITLLKLDRSLSIGAVANGYVNKFRSSIGA